MVCVATTCFTGFLPWLVRKRGKGGGLIGSVVGVVIVALVFASEGFSEPSFVVLCLTSFLLCIGVFAVQDAEKVMLLKWGRRPRHTGECAYHDFNETNIDEFVGQMIALLPLCFVHEHMHFITELHFYTLLLTGLALFRVFDTTKWLGISRVEKWSTLNTALPIMFDDVLAGIYAGIVLVVAFILPTWYHYLT